MESRAEPSRSGGPARVHDGFPGPDSLRRMEEQEVLNQIEIATPGFNAEVHSGILKRCLIIGYTLEQIAEIVGVDPNRLVKWISTKPTMVEAYLEAKEADSKVCWALYCAAIGQHPETAAATTPSVSAMKFWLLSRGGWNDKPQAPPREKNLEDLSVSELMNIVDELKSKITAAVPIETTATRVKPDFPQEEDVEYPEGTVPFPEEETDAGF